MGLLRTSESAGRRQVDSATVCIRVRACVCVCVQACVGMENVACNYKPIVTTLSRLVVRCNVLLSIKELVCVKYKIVQRRAPPQLNMQSKLNSAP